MGAGREVLTLNAGGVYEDRCPGCSGLLPPDVPVRAGLYVQTAVTVHIRPCLKCAAEVMGRYGIKEPLEAPE